MNVHEISFEKSIISYNKYKNKFQRLTHIHIIQTQACKLTRSKQYYSQNTPQRITYSL